MQQVTYTIRDEHGIHARPAGLLVKTAGEFSSDISIEGNGKTADAKRLFGVMGLGIKQGDHVTVTAEGADEMQAVLALEQFLKTHL